jgi:hypothetical protein
MNVYSQDVFINDCHFLGAYHIDSSNDLGVKLKEKELEMKNDIPYEDRKFCLVV